MKNILLVGLGGMIGSMLRYQFGLWLTSKTLQIPIGTLAVNIIGSFLIGLLAGTLTKNPSFSLLLITGLCGGFTTFSAFSLENLKLIQSGQIWTAVLYTGLSVGAGILSCFGSFYLVLKIGNPIN